jgi:GR25 family glycosyltransferase involved in LPS biosynthesis
MAVLDCFDHAFVLNRAQDIDRMNRTREELTRCHIPFERINGITVINRLEAILPGELGCLLAHLRAVRLARKRGYRSIVIFEDDVVLRPDFLDLWKGIPSQLKAIRYDLFYPYQWRSRASHHKDIRIVRFGGTICNHFYAIHSIFYSRYIAIVEKNLATPRPRPIDWMFRSDQLRIYATSFNLAGQRNGISVTTGFDRANTTFGRFAA